MPDFPELLLNQLDIGTRLLRALDVKGENLGRISPRYDAEILAEDLTQEEFLWLRRYGRYSNGAGQAAVAAQNSVVCWGPSLAQRSMLGVLELFSVLNTTAAAIQVSFGVADPSAGAPVAVGAGRPLDDRQTGSTAVIPFFGVAAAATATPPLAAAFQLLVSANSEQLVQLPVVLTGNSGTGGRFHFYVQGPLNTALTCGFVWRERPLLPSELTGTQP